MEPHESTLPPDMAARFGDFQAKMDEEWAKCGLPVSSAKLDPISIGVMKALAVSTGSDRDGDAQLHYHLALAVDLLSLVMNRTTAAQQEHILAVLRVATLRKAYIVRPPILETHPAYAPLPLPPVEELPDPAEVLTRRAELSKLLRRSE